MTETLPAQRRAQKNPQRGKFKREFARELRHKMTAPERKLWSFLRRKQIRGLRFRRQQPIGPYIADFYCPGAKLIIELDGGQHGELARRAYDEARTAWLAGEGYYVVRIANAEFLRHRGDTLDWIWHLVETRTGVTTKCAEAGPLPEARRASTLPQGEG